MSNPRLGNRLKVARREKSVVQNASYKWACHFLRGPSSLISTAGNTFETRRSEIWSTWFASVELAIVAWFQPASLEK